MNELDFSNELKMLGDLLVSQYRDVLARDGINATDRLSNTAGVEVTKGATFWDLSLRLEDYWKYVEYGRRAGKRPPIDAIEKWIEAKPVIPTPDANGDIPTPHSLAYLIARKIGLEGTTPRHALQEAQQGRWADAVRELADRVFKEEDAYIVRMFKP